MNGWLLFLLAMVVLVLTGIAVTFLGQHPGYILIAYGDTRIELTLWTGIGLLILGCVALYVLVLVLRIPFLGWRNGRAMFEGRKAKAQEQRAANGLIAYIEGHWDKARKILSQLAGQKESPLMYNLLSARASHALGDEQSADKYLLAAEESSSKADLAVGLTQAEMQVDRGQFEGALATLMRVRAVSSTHPAALKLLAQVYQGLGEWGQVRKLLPELRKANVLSSEEIHELECSAYSDALMAAVRGKEGVSGLEKAWKHVPRSLASDPCLTSTYVEQLIDLGEPVKAERFIHHSLSQSWDEQLVDWYGRVLGHNVASQLATVEAWLQQRGGSAALLLAAGRLCLANRKWDKAREYFEASLKQNPSAEAYAELGRLLSSQGDSADSVDLLQKGIAISSRALPDLPQPPRTAVAVPPPAIASVSPKAPGSTPASSSTETSSS